MAVQSRLDLRWREVARMDGRRSVRPALHILEEAPNEDRAGLTIELASGPPSLEVDAEVVLGDDRARALRLVLSNLGIRQRRKLGAYIAQGDHTQEAQEMGSNGGLNADQYDISGPVMA